MLPVGGGCSTDVADDGDRRAPAVTWPLGCLEANQGLDKERIKRSHPSRVEAGVGSGGMGWMNQSRVGGSDVLQGRVSHCKLWPLLVFG